MVPKKEVGWTVSHEYHHSLVRERASTRRTEQIKRYLIDAQLQCKANNNRRIKKNRISRHKNKCKSMKMPFTTSVDFGRLAVWYASIYIRPCQNILHMKRYSVRVFFFWSKRIIMLLCAYVFDFQRKCYIRINLKL